MTEPTASDAAISDPRVTRFVRDTLGCRCPDEVFERIRIIARADAFAGLPVETVIDVGGRLLVAVCASTHWREVLQTLPAIARSGRAYRDRHGYNRFRLVVAAPEPELAQPALAAVFDAASAEDEHMHLHVLAPQALAGVASATMK